MKINEEIIDFLNQKVEEYNTKVFIEEDPISIPHQFSKKEDIEIIGFIIAIISWGKRAMIIKNGQKLIEIMGNQPHDFILNGTKNDFKDIHFVHRTFNSIDLAYFFHALQNIYRSGKSLEDLFSIQKEPMNLKINRFRSEFLNFQPEKRTFKHISDPLKNSSAKRINMYLRWMVRKDNKGVDFGIWNQIAPSELYCPLDVHTGNVGRKLGFIKRNVNDWKALEELMIYLRKFDKLDPVKYDYALFGLGVYEKF